MAGVLSPQQQQLLMMGLYGSGGDVSGGVPHSAAMLAFPDSSSFPVSAAMANGGFGGFPTGAEAKY